MNTIELIELLKTASLDDILLVRVRSKGKIQNFDAFRTHAIVKGEPLCKSTVDSPLIRLGTATEIGLGAVTCLRCQGNLRVLGVEVPDTTPRSNEASKKIIYDGIVQYKRENDGNAPTLRWLAGLVGTASTSYVLYCLNQLEREGLIIIRRHVGEYNGRAMPKPHPTICVVGGEWRLNDGEK